MENIVKAVKVATVITLTTVAALPLIGLVAYNVGFETESTNLLMAGLNFITIN